jgi:hypothetical protein
MTISADTHIILDVHSPKKDAVVGEGVPTVPDSSCAIWANGILKPEFTTQTIASWRSLFRAMLEESKKPGAAALVISGGIDAGENTFAFAAPNVTEIGFYIGSDVTSVGATHFIDRTMKRLLERWLELAKTGSGLVPAKRAGVSQLDDNRWDFEGNFEAGDNISITLQVTDPDGLTEGDSIVILLPDLPPGQVYNPDGVAEIVCQGIASQVHYRCARTGSVINIGSAAPANTVTSNLAVLLGS